MDKNQTKRRYHSIMAIGVFAMALNSLLGLFNMWALPLNIIWFYVITIHGSKLFQIDNLGTDNREKANK